MGREGKGERVGREWWEEREEEGWEERGWDEEQGSASQRLLPHVVTVFAVQYHNKKMSVCLNHAATCNQS